MFYIYIFLFLIFNFGVKAIDFIPKAAVKTGVLMDNYELILDGYIKSTIGYKGINLNMAIAFENDAYIFDLSNINNNQHYIGEIFLDYSIANSKFSLGYLNSVASKRFLLDILDKEQPYLGVDAISYKNTEGYSLSNAFLNNNTSLSLYYLNNLLDDSLYLGASYTPDMNKNIRNYDIVLLETNKENIDVLLLYYGEMAGLGYGFNIASRMYTSTTNSFNETFDNQLGIFLDFLGFSLQSSILKGDNIISILSNKTDYSAVEYSLFYYFYNINFGIYIMESDINIINNIPYKTELLEFAINYNYSNTVALHSSFFRTDISGIDDKGVILAITVNL